MVNAAVQFVLLKLPEIHRLCADFAADWTAGALTGFMFHKLVHLKSPVTVLALTNSQDNVLGDDVDEKENAHKNVQDAGGDVGLLHAFLNCSSDWLSGTWEGFGISELTNVKAEGTYCHYGGREIEEPKEVGH
jgi:hypothetical protein